MSIEQQMYDEVIELIRKRYPTGWGGAAAVRLIDGTILTSVAPEVINDSTHLCMETGAILEAHKLNKKVTHSICLARDDEMSPYKVLSLRGVPGTFILLGSRREMRRHGSGRRARFQNVGGNSAVSLEHRL